MAFWVETNVMGARYTKRESYTLLLSTEIGGVAKSGQFQKDLVYFAVGTRRSMPFLGEKDS